MEYFRQRFIDLLNEDGNVCIRSFEWPPAEVLKTMSPNDYDAHFVEWVGEMKGELLDRTKKFLIKFNCLDRFNRLQSQVRLNSVIPFVGAGMSKASGFPLWRDFLESLTADYPSVSGALTEALDADKYEEAAQILFEQMGEDAFAESIQNTFGSFKKSIKGPIKIMPQIFKSGCITTNFDYVLDQVYDDSDFKFHGKCIGNNLRESPRILAGNPHCLIRLHGEADSAYDRVLTQSEYETCYGEGGKYPEIIKAIIANNSLLFLGCSLSVDRTIVALSEIKKSAQVATPRHYAFLPYIDGADREKRRVDLAAADIYPIWYPPEDHDGAIEDLLIALFEGEFHN